MVERPTPTERELDILKILWLRGEASVRDVYEELRERLPIVQNTVQALLRIMEDKGLVRHRTEGRTFIYTPQLEREETTRRLASELLQRAFDGAVDQMVHSLFTAQPPTDEEVRRLEAMITDLRPRRKADKKGETKA